MHLKFSQNNKLLPIEWNWSSFHVFMKTWFILQTKENSNCHWKYSFLSSLARIMSEISYFFSSCKLTLLWDYKWTIMVADLLQNKNSYVVKICFYSIKIVSHSINFIFVISLLLIISKYVFIQSKWISIHYEIFLS